VFTSCLLHPALVAPQGNLTVKEGQVGMVPLRLHVTDRDLAHTPAWNAVYTIEGDTGGNFKMETDPNTNDGVLTVIKVSRPGCVPHHLDTTTSGMITLQSNCKRAKVLKNEHSTRTQNGHFTSYRNTSTPISTMEVKKHYSQLKCTILYVRTFNYFSLLTPLVGK